MDVRVQNYDQIKGWEVTQPGWYEYEITIHDANNTETYEEILEWLYNRIDNCERHVRWMMTRENVRLKFRHERDVILCKLSF